MRTQTIFSVFLTALLILFGCSEKIQVSGLELDKSEIQLKKGETRQLILTIMPEDAFGLYETVWTSDDESVAIVSGEGLITAVGIGTANITATVDGKSAICIVNVVEVPVESIKLNKIAMDLKIGESEKIEVTIMPEDADVAEISFVSSDVNIAAVSDDGVVSGVYVGDAVITVMAGDAVAECNVHVIPSDVESISLDMSSVEIIKNESVTLNATVKPEINGNNIIWKSSSELIAKVVNGVVTGMAPGTATITANCGDKSAYCEVNVLPINAESIAVDPQTIEMQQGEKCVISATVTPSDYDGELLWTSSDENIAIVNELGEVTAVSDGQAIIRASVDNLYAECIVTVKTESLLNIGDYYYSDGTWSSELDNSKTCIGVVFWVGNPSEDDPTLKKEHPECTNGLVVSLHDVMTSWWGNWNLWIEEKQSTCIADWILVQTDDYVNIKQGSSGEPLQNAQGYNNTRALEYFNSSDENAEWPVTIVESCEEYRNRVVAPDSSSDWYVPSAKELSLLCTGDYEGDLMGFDLMFKCDIRNLINTKLSVVPEAQQLKTDGSYWSSSVNNAQWSYNINMNFAWVALGNMSGSDHTRYILAF